MIFIGHVAHWSYGELLDMEIEELMDVHEECVELYKNLNSTE